MDSHLQSIFEEAYSGFHSDFYREKDPVRFVHLYSRREDQEVVGLISALLAYGNVKIILKSVGDILRHLGESPAKTIQSGDFYGRFANFRHRFTTGEDIEILLCWIRSALDSHGSLHDFFCRSRHPQMRDQLSAFVRNLTGQPLPKELEEVRMRRARNLKYLVSDPHQGSACKRLNLYLRWMVRPADGVDVGIWKNVDPAQLMLPVDTHILKIIRRLRWTRSQQANWKVVEQATARLRRLNAADPIRYDFSLCHLLMEGNQALYEKMARRPVHQKGASRKLRSPIGL